MSLIEQQLISKVIDENIFYQLDKHNLKNEDFVVIPDVYEFVKGYVKEYGNTPDYKTVTENCEGFEYQGEVTNNISYMTKSLKSNTAKRKSYELLQKQVSSNFEKMTGTQFVNWLAEQTKVIADEANSAASTGTNVAVNGQERKQMYLEGKENRTGKFIPTPYPTLTEWLGGGFELGDYLLLLAYTNKGKSWIATDMGQVAWANSFGVLHYSPELSKSQMVQRWDTLHGHFNNTQLKLGKLPEFNESKYYDYLDQFNEKQETPYIMKTMEDLDNGLSIDVVRADLEQHPEIKMVIIDGFNLMKHGSNRDGNRNAMSNTSRELRRLFGKFGVVGCIVHQTPTAAEKDAEAYTNNSDDTDNRTIKAPDITDYSETNAVIQDAATVLTFNQRDGQGKMKLAKARTPNVDKEFELICDFNIGVIREPELIDEI